MEHLIEAIRALAAISSSDARLALLIVGDELRAILSDADALALAAALPLELALVVARDPEEHEWEAPALDDLQDTLDARMVAAVCGVLASEVPAEMATRLLGDLPGRLAQRLGAGRPISQTWSLVDSTRPTVRVDCGATSRPTLPARAG